MMEIRFGCPPEYEGLLPPPLPAAKALPDWLRTMPAKAHDQETGQDVRTLKQCPPLLDALNLGFLVFLPVDVTVAPGPGFIWDWRPPVCSLEGFPRSPLSFHVAAQGKGVPFAREEQRFLKFLNFWTIATDPGVSILVTHPLNRPDLPFTTLSGVIDTDGYGAGLIHFPAIWRDPSFRGVLARGTPVAQVVPFRREPVEAKVGAMTPEELTETNKVRQAIDAEPGVYRKQFRRRGGPEAA
jgi:hypothetical protein